jgi:hypothetical protein
MPDSPKRGEPRTKKLPPDQPSLPTRAPTSQPLTGNRRDGRSLSTTVTELGYVMSECRSALQKSIRRGDEQAAVWWTAQIVKHGWWAYWWRCMKVIASEDIGMAAPDVAVQVAALHENAKDATQNWKHLRHAGLIEMNALLLCVRAPKCWTATHCWLSVSRQYRLVQRGEAERPTVPDYAHDHHVRRDVPKNRWLEEGDRLQPPGETHHLRGGDPWASIRDFPDDAMEEG